MCNQDTEKIDFPIKEYHVFIEMMRFLGHYHDHFQFFCTVIFSANLPLCFVEVRFTSKWAAPSATDNVGVSVTSVSASVSVSAPAPAVSQCWARMKDACVVKEKKFASKLECYLISNWGHNSKRRQGGKVRGENK